MPATADPLPPRATDEHRQLLADAFDRAYVAARVAVSKDGTAVDVTLLSSGKLPFDHNTHQAGTWLAQNGIDASAHYNGVNDIVLSIAPAAVERLIDVLLSPHLRARAMAARLDDLLTPHAFLSDVGVVSGDRIQLTLTDVAIGGAGARFAELLGASGIADDLDLTRGKGLRRLADRLMWLVTGTTGTRVLFDPVTACRHETDALECWLTTEQARRLADRIPARPKEPDHG